MKNVVFLRPYKVPAGGEGEFLEAWQRFATCASGFEGFVRSEVLRCLEDSSEWTHVSQVEVRSYALLTEAMKDPKLLELRNAVPFGGPPASFEPVEFMAPPAPDLS